MRKKRVVGNVSIYVTDDSRLFIKDRTSDTKWEMTNEYRSRQIDEQLMDELERRVRSGERCLDARGSGHGPLLDFLK